MSYTRVVYRFLFGVMVISVVAGMTVGHGFRIEETSPPSRSAQEWALAALEPGDAPAAPQDAHTFRTAGPIVVIGWEGGAPAWRFVGSSKLVESVLEAKAQVDRRADARSLRFTITVPIGEGPVLRGIPVLAALSVVPLRDGLLARRGSAIAVTTPNELQAAGAYQAGYTFVVEDVRFGLDLERWVEVLAAELDAPVDEVEVRRFSAFTFSSQEYPDDGVLSSERLRSAGLAAASFVARHQEPTGRFTYRYDGHTGLDRGGSYNLARHAGTVYFLAQAYRLTQHEEAKNAAIAGLQFVKHNHIDHCGPASNLCVVRGSRNRARVGESALTAIAAAELLRTTDLPWVRDLLAGLVSFLRAQQRPDGELMHEYDRERGVTVDVQQMYVSGQAALAFLLSHRLTADPSELDAARTLLEYVTTDGWNFLGSRYYYGQEHWTCMAVAEGWDRIPRDASLDFCLRWGEWHRALQYREGETPWNAAGAFGVGPIFVPVMTPAGSVSEALIPIYHVARREGRDTAWLKATIDEAMAFALRWQWNPGPEHLLANPAEAAGAFPANPSSFEARNDYAQHVGNALLQWAEL